MSAAAFCPEQPLSDDGDRPDPDEDYHHTPRLIPALLGERVRGIAAGSNTSCAVTDAGELFTWGQNAFGSLGHGNELRRVRPTLVTALVGIRVVGVSIDTKHALALAADGSVYCSAEGPGLGIRQKVG